MNVDGLIGRQMRAQGAAGAGTVVGGVRHERGGDAVDLLICETVDGSLFYADFWQVRMTDHMAVVPSRNALHLAKRISEGFSELCEAIAEARSR